MPVNLSEKLRAFVKQPNPHENKIATPDETDICQVLKGVRIKNVYGEHLLISKTYDEFFSHGGIVLSKIFDIAPEALMLISKNREFTKFDFSRTLFVDTETTGLAGGSGTYAFLIGVGYFDGSNFKIRQYFMRDFNEEAAMLYSLQKLFRNFEFIVTFNGKAFDVPLIATRFLINRMENPLEKFIHLDLLSCARRLYGERLESVSLSSLEKNLFCITRQGDVPGYLIPSIYFKFLSDRNPYPLRPVIYHNGMDILSLVTLTVRIADIFENPISSENCVDEDYLCVARVYQDMGFFNESISCYMKALEVPHIQNKAYLQLSMLLKKLNRWQEASNLWHYMVEKQIYEDIALIELAKYYEHKVKDYIKAAEATEKAISLLYKKRAMGCSYGYFQSELKKLKKRQERLNLKIKRQTNTV